MRMKAESGMKLLSGRDQKGWPANPQMLLSLGLRRNPRGMHYQPPGPMENKLLKHLFELAQERADRIPLILLISWNAFQDPSGFLKLWSVATPL